MNNFEKIKQMAVDEMAECFFSWEFLMEAAYSQENIKQWLLQEVEE